MTKAHSFHIPVMGTGFSVDTPLKVSQYGIDSVISLVDDILLEKLRKFYCEKFGFPYQEISNKIKDFRAKRITSYLNLINEIAKRKFEELKAATIERGHELKEYFHMLPDRNVIKQKIKRMLAEYFDWEEVLKPLKELVTMGSIDVNIMTKLDKENYFKKEKLPVEFNDAHAALRGYANSDLNSSIVLSAGMNPRLYGYFEQFGDFYPDAGGDIKKKIIIKVSDYRSAFIQGKFLAKKGLWVSEYRIESGLNCGGHAFATDGYLMGPILAEFRDKRQQLKESVYEILVQALEKKNRPVPTAEPPLKITAQGGVGTAEEHQFLIEHYKLDSVGWGTPFLLVPEVTNLDELTRNQLKEAREDDLYLSNISPLGVPFNNLKANSKDLEKRALLEKGRPGSPCPKKYLVSNKEFTEKHICTASRQYQHLKLKELEDHELSTEDFREQAGKIVDKSCICVGLGTSALLVNNLNTKIEGDGVSVCPGPNMAYFSNIMSLREMIDHIYGRSNVIERKDRPNMFIKELRVYVDFLRNKIEDATGKMTGKQAKYFFTFIRNLEDGIDYYCDLFSQSTDAFEDSKASALRELTEKRNELGLLKTKVEESSPTEN
jgi:hypothetical protein